MIFKRFWLAGVGLLAGVCTAAATEPVTPAAALKAAQQGIADLTADFTLTVEGAGADGQDLKASGKLWLQSGRRYRVHYEKPEEQVLVSDGTKRWLYLKAINQVQIQALPPAGDAAEFFLELGGGLPALIDRCQVTRLPRAGGLAGYLLIPKAGEGLGFERVRLWVHGPAMLPRRVEVDAGRTVRAEFTHTVVHAKSPKARPHPQGLAEDWFVFQPPADAEVIEVMWPVK